MSGDALAYKEELMRKQREKQNLQNMTSPEEAEDIKKEENKKDGIL